MIAVGSAADIASSRAQPWLQQVAVTLSEDVVADRRVVTVESTAAAIAELITRVQTWPQAATVCDEVLRAVDPIAPALTGVIRSRSRTRRCSRAGSSPHGWSGEDPPRRPSYRIRWSSTVTATPCTSGSTGR
jgi:hypothetical protein